MPELPYPVFPGQRAVGFVTAVNTASTFDNSLDVAALENLPEARRAEQEDLIRPLRGPPASPRRLIGKQTQACAIAALPLGRTV